MKYIEKYKEMSMLSENAAFEHLLSSLKDTIRIWVTDGEGWLTAKRPLSETFRSTDYVMNINMIEQGLLEEIVTKGL